VIDATIASYCVASFAAGAAFMRWARAIAACGSTHPYSDPDDVLLGAYWGLNYNPPPTFPPPSWMLELDEELAREWREKTGRDEGEC
jgi:hypothetical protein